jgi:hypothetical protein
MALKISKLFFGILFGLKADKIRIKFKKALISAKYGVYPKAIHVPSICMGGYRNAIYGKSYYNGVTHKNLSVLRIAFWGILAVFSAPTACFGATGGVSFHIIYVANGVPSRHRVGFGSLLVVMHRINGDDERDHRR